jgi:broad specificity phosphatase PhoE
VKGTHTRQRRTAQLVGEVYQLAGLSFPEPILMEELEEFSGGEVLKRALPRILDMNADVRTFYQRFSTSSNTRDRHKNCQKIFEIVTGMWVRGEVDVPDVEPWPEFSMRVNRAITLMLSDRASGSETAVFTSGGPIAVAVERALRTSIENTLRLAWVIRNASYSEFKFSGKAFTLSTFNTVPHLGDLSLLTYR